MLSHSIVGIASLILAGTGLPKATEDSSDNTPIELLPFVVLAHPEVDAQVIAPVLSASIPRTPDSVIRSFESTPGLSMGRRGPSSMEPNIRGFTFDRNLTSWNGLPLPNASPTRTGAPINASALLIGSTLDIHLTGNDLVSGAAISGGRIVFETPLGREDDQTNTAAHLSWGSNPLRISATARNTWKSGAFHGTAAITHSQQGDYSSGNGTHIPSSLKEGGLHTTLGWNHGNTSHALALLWHKVDEGENPALPQDTVSSETTAITTIHRAPIGSAGGSIRLRSGWAKSMPRLSNSPRPIRPALVDAASNARTIHGDLLHTLPIGDSLLVRSAFDLDYQRRNAVRIRNRKLQDVIWPDIASEHYGLALSIDHHRPDSPLLLQSQFRIDHHTDEAKSANRITLGKPVRDWYAAYTDGADLDLRSTHTLPSLSFNAAWNPALRPWKIHASVAASSQNPTPTERFRAMLPALGGGYEIGNPNLDSEYKIHGELGFHLENRQGFVHLSVWHSEFDSFIQRQAIGTFQNTPLFGFRNVRAHLSGVEWTSSFDLMSHRRRINTEYPRLNLPLSVSWTEGRFHQTDQPWIRLAEVPPLRIRTGIEHGFHHENKRVHLAAYANWEASRTNPDTQLFPTQADAGEHLTFDFQALLHTPSDWSIELQILNVGNLQYARHLSPLPALPLANGSPLPPDKAIPEPGRCFLLSLSKRF